jgi:hypothetical protein
MLFNKHPHGRHLLQSARVVDVSSMGHVQVTVLDGIPYHLDLRG